MWPQICTQHVAIALVALPIVLFSFHAREKGGAMWLLSHFSKLHSILIFAIKIDFDLTSQ